jgi:pentatricopeptide repeat protein
MVLKACSRLRDLETGRQVHKDLVKSGIGLDNYLENSLVSLYVKCESLEDAPNVSEVMTHQNVVSWNIIIAGLSRHGLDEKAFEMFWKMEQKRVKPDNVNFITILSACTNPATLEKGKRLHSLSIEADFGSDLRLGNVLMSI